MRTLALLVQRRKRYLKRAGCWPRPRRRTNRRLCWTTRQLHQRPWRVRPECRNSTGKYWRCGGKAGRPAEAPAWSRWSKTLWVAPSSPSRRAAAPATADQPAGMPATASGKRACTISWSGPEALKRSLITSSCEYNFFFPPLDLFPPAVSSSVYFFYRGDLKNYYYMYMYAYS